MIQVEFANKAKEILQTDETIIGLAVGGSWISDQMDEFSDLDLIIVTEQKVTGDKNVMINYAKRLGNFLSAFTGEHVGEPRLLICLYDNPLLHVDLKFVTLEEFHERVETPTILLDKNGRLQKVIDHSVSSFPYPDYQWLEDRFWIWIHYALLKVGRGEYFEAFDFLGFLRMSVFGPLLHIKNKNLPRGVRKVETDLEVKDLEDLKLTLPQYNRHSLLECLRHSVLLYRKLRNVLFGNNIILQDETEKKVMLYFEELKEE
ncbi:nucleotidyltransferase domain-containing protein [Chryseobacterium sp. CKR4-1]|uniref:nucleotidyltransferase domain-containing protein n=1 Tax=Chryseobacterium sp. CKR4-1 TaxID=3068896 RepID=UPI0027965BDC|nr:nucleotidyltransferase domain-containing protein [Chryseobacterium sp. CKR4-1]MDQ1802497.1 nucleotidyltransferase domain-containing protein [Chryseobacterium sp. CKR4-1]